MKPKNTKHSRSQAVPKDPVQAVAWYREAAERGDVKAQHNLGTCYVSGEGVGQDPVQAVDWFRKAAEQGHADAQFYLGMCYHEGWGVAKNPAQAVAWYRKAAEQGVVSAQHNLGMCYTERMGVAKDHVQAVAWFRKAAERGFAASKHNVGYAYETGEGVAKDPVQAVAWYRKAAAQGYSLAEHRLGMCYRDGTGVAKDPAQAIVWFRKAAAQGLEIAQKDLRKAVAHDIAVARRALNTREVVLKIEHSYGSKVLSTKTDFFGDETRLVEHRYNTFESRITKPIRGLASMTNEVFCPYCGHAIGIRACSDTATFVANCLGMLWIVVLVVGIYNLRSCGDFGPLGLGVGTIVIFSIWGEPEYVVKESTCTGAAGSHTCTYVKDV